MVLAFFVVVVVVLALVLRLTMVSVELLNEGHTVVAVVQFGFETEENLLPVPTQPCAAVAEPGAGIGDPPLFRRSVVAGANAPAAAPEHPVAGSVFQTGAASAERVGCTGRSGQESAKPLVGMAVSFVVATDGVDRAAHGIAAVEQGRRSLDDLQALQLCGIDQFSMIAGL